MRSKSPVVVLMGVMPEYDKGHLEIKVRGQIQGAFEGREETIILGSEGQAYVVVVPLRIVNLVFSAVHIDVEDIGVVSEEVPCAVSEMGIDIHDQKALQPIALRWRMVMATSLK